MPQDADEILSRKHTTRILQFLRNNGSLTQADVHEYITNWKIVKERVDVLVEAGLVEETIERDGRIRIRYIETDKGHVTGSLLVLVDAVIKGELDLEDEFLSVIEEKSSEIVRKKQM